MRFLSVGLALAILSSCTCGGPGVSRTYGELYVVQLGSTGREQLVREATVRGPATFMDTVGTFEVPVRNVGLEGVSIESVTKLEGDDTLTLENVVGLQVAASGDAALAVRFAPTQAADATLPEVEHRAKYELAIGGAREGEDKIVLELVALAVARDCYVPRRVDFGLVPLQQAIISPLALENGRALEATTTFGALSGSDPSAFFIDATSPVAVAAGGRVELKLRFSPLEARAYSARFTLQRDAQCPAGEVELVGEGSTEALTWAPARLDFGRIPLGFTGAKTVTVTNRSNVALSLAALLPAGSFGVSPGAPTSVPARGQAVVEVQCAPIALGPLTELLTLEVGTVPVTPARIPLSCAGGGPRVRVDPDPIQFGQVPFNGAGSLVTKRRIIVQNVGTAPPAPGDPTNNLVLGRQGSLPWFAIIPKNARTRLEEFSVSQRSTTYDNAVGLPAVAGQNYVEFEVGIAPTSIGLREADLVVYSNDSLQPELRIPITAGPRVPDSCVVTVAPEGVDFGATPRGAVLSRVVTVKNEGAATGPACLVSGIEMAPGSNLAFLVDEPALASLVVPGGQTRGIRVQAVVPNTANVGDYLRGVLRLSIAGESTPRQLPVDLRVSRCLVVDPPLVDLGLVQENCTSGTRAITLYNVCGLPITLTNVSSPAAPFRLLSSPLGNGPVTLDPADQLSVTVAMRPTAPGSFADVLQFDTLEAGVQQVEAVALRGRADAVGVQREQFTQGSAEVDILLVIDDSCSMADEQNSLATNFAAFMSAAAQGNSNWQIGVTTTDVFATRGELKRTPSNPAVLKPTTPNLAALFADKVRVGVTGSGFEQPFAAMTMAVTEPNRSGPNAGFLRTNAALAVVIVTDAPEQSPNSVGSYLATLRTAKQNRNELVSVSVVGPFMPTSATCSTEGAVDLTRYAAAITNTNGVQADICTQNWSMDLESISRNLFGNRRSFELAGQARSSNDIDVLVDGVQRSSGWSYSAATNTITFNSPPPPGALIEIEYLTACF
jgi:hypothetical protein